MMLPAPPQSGCILASALDASFTVHDLIKHQRIIWGGPLPPRIWYGVSHKLNLALSVGKCSYDCLAVLISTVNQTKLSLPSFKGKVNGVQQFTTHLTATGTRVPYGISVTCHPAEETFPPCKEIHVLLCHIMPGR